jgi:L-ascorbate metabolism protein UlaG (beta-lactamase superfamily)
MDTSPPTVDGRPELELRFIGHATLLLQVAGARILTDPFLRGGLGPLERHGPVPDPKTLGEVDLVLISHGHRDHFDPRSLAALTGHPTVVVPRGLATATRRWVDGDVVELSVTERHRFDGVTVEAVPARHWMTPGGPPAHPQGYLIDGGFRVWFAGDTGRFDALGELAGRVDVALLPVWTWGPHLGPGHLGPRSAAEVLATIGAPVAIPIHWGTLYPRRLDRIWAAPLAEPGDRFAEHAARVAPRSQVRVLRPGDSTRFASAASKGTLTRASVG